MVMSELLTNEVQVELGVKASEQHGDLVHGICQDMAQKQGSTHQHTNWCIHYYNRTANKAQFPTVAIHLLGVTRQSYYSNPGPNFIKVH